MAACLSPPAQELCIVVPKAARKETMETMEMGQGLLSLGL